MADWTKPFRARYEWWRVDRRSYRKSDYIYDDYYNTGDEVERIESILSATLQLNDSTDTFETGIARCVGPLDVGADLIRCHLVAEWDDGTSEDVVLGTFNVSVPSRDVCGPRAECSAVLDGRLIELKEDYLEQPYVVPKSNNPIAYTNALALLRGITFANSSTEFGGWTESTRTYGLGVSEDSSVLAVFNDLVTNVSGARAAKTDGYGRIRYQWPIDYGADPVWEFREGANATFLTDAVDEFDVSGVCNAVAAVFEDEDGTVVGLAEDTDPASPWSIASYGRRKVAVYTYQYGATQAQANAKAAQLLEENRSVLHRVTIRHTWCPARVGDIVSLEYPSTGISGTFAIRAQTIDVGSGGCLTTSELRRFERV